MKKPSPPSWHRRLLWPFCLTLWAFITSGFPASAQKEVLLNLGPNPELGALRDAVRSGYENLHEINSSRLLLTNRTNLHWETALANILLKNVPERMGELAPLLGEFITHVREIDSIFAAAQEIENMDLPPLEALNRQLDGLSPIDFSLNEIREELLELRTMAAKPIPPLSENATVSILVSNEARDEAIALRKQAQDTISFIESLDFRLLVQSVNDSIGKVNTFHQATDTLIDELAELRTKWKVPLLLDATIANVLAISGQLLFLPDKLREISTTLGELANELSYSRQNELLTLVLNLDAALAEPPIESHWVTKGSEPLDTLWYSISFKGRSWTHPSAEIDGDFEIGTLSITNRNTPLERRKIQHNLDISIERTIPGLNFDTHTPLSLKLLHHCSLGDLNACNSPDWFSLGTNWYSSQDEPKINLPTCENATTHFRIFARYESPLRITRVEAYTQDGNRILSENQFLHASFHVKVTGGSGGGLYPIRDTVTLVARIPDGHQFVKWVGDVPSRESDSIHNPHLTFSMPPTDVEVEAITEPIPKWATLHVTGGKGGGIYRLGEHVPVAAQVPLGKRFVRWKGDASALTNAESPITVVHLRANLSLTAELAEASVANTTVFYPPSVEPTPVLLWRRGQPIRESIRIGHPRGIPLAVTVHPSSFDTSVQIRYDSTRGMLDCYSSSVTAPLGRQTITYQVSSTEGQATGELRVLVVPDTDYWRLAEQSFHPKDWKEARATLPGADFDADGMPNSREIAFFRDPADDWDAGREISPTIRLINFPTVEVATVEIAIQARPELRRLANYEIYLNNNLRRGEWWGFFGVRSIIESRKEGIPVLKLFYIDDITAKKDRRYYTFRFSQAADPDSTPVELTTDLSFVTD